MVISKKTIIFQRFRGDPTFSRGGGQLFSSVGGGGVQILISIETQMTCCDFPRGSGPVIPPLDPHMCSHIIT